MAYLQPQQRTCPDCGLSGQVKWVIGVGPNSVPGKKPYRKLHHLGPFERSAKDRNALICPKCGASVP